MTSSTHMSDSETPSPHSAPDRPDANVVFTWEGEEYRVPQTLASLLAECADVKQNFVSLCLQRSRRSYNERLCVALSERQLKEAGNFLREIAVLDRELMCIEQTHKQWTTNRIQNLQSVLRRSLVAVETWPPGQELDNELRQIRIGNAGLTYEEEVLNLQTGSRSNLLGGVLRLTGLESEAKVDRSSDTPMDVRSRVKAAIAFLWTLVSPAEVARLDQCREAGRLYGSRTLNDLSADERIALVRGNTLPPFFKTHGLTENQWLTILFTMHQMGHSDEERMRLVLMQIPPTLREALLEERPASDNNKDEWLFKKVIRFNFSSSRPQYTLFHDG